MICIHPYRPSSANFIPYCRKVGIGSKQRLHLAATMGLVDAVQQITGEDAHWRKNEDELGCNTLHRTAAAGQASVVQYLLSQWPEGLLSQADTFEQEGWTPLHYAAYGPQKRETYHFGCDFVGTILACLAVAPAVCEAAGKQRLVDRKDLTAFGCAIKGFHTDSLRDRCQVFLECFSWEPSTGDWNLMADQLRDPHLWRLIGGRFSFPDSLLAGALNSSVGNPGVVVDWCLKQANVYPLLTQALERVQRFPENVKYGLSQSLLKCAQRATQCCVWCLTRQSNRVGLIGLQPALAEAILRYLWTPTTFDDVIME
eukprot:TRINITY_DN54531_c0_g1_i1.p1 TRINITY_DN54531_c0_g1~~TRINITY_DN54531_c0_g1_i1.p1  ORF type:complete len:313 (-),score=5.91 TRINITY_DN54531_c0_g1_i1:33-971(-)